MFFISIHFHIYIYIIDFGIRTQFRFWWLECERRTRSLKSVKTKEATTWYPSSIFLPLQWPHRLNREKIKQRNVLRLKFEFCFCASIPIQHHHCFHPSLSSLCFHPSPSSLHFHPSLSSLCFHPSSSSSLFFHLSPSPSSSSRTDRTDFLDSLSPPVPTVYCFWPVL